MKIQMKGASITDVPRKDGRYQGYATVQGVRRYVYGRTKEEVERKLERLLKNGYKPAARAKKAQTFTLRSWLDYWLDVKKRPNLKETSYIVTRALLDRVPERFGSIPLGKLSTLDCDALLAAFPSPSTRFTLYFHVKAALTVAVKSALIARNPMDGVEAPKKTHGKRHALTRDEQARVLSAAATVRKGKYLPLVRFLLCTGLRIGEALALTPSDFSDGSVSVTKNIAHVNGKDIAQNMPKSDAGIRTVPVPPEAMPQMNSPRVFPLNASSFGDALHKIGEQVGVDLSPHILRHTYATRLAEANIPQKARQYLLGHATADMTENVYTDAQADFIAAQARKIAEIFAKKNDFDT